MTGWRWYSTEAFYELANRASKAFRTKRGHYLSHFLPVLKRTLIDYFTCNRKRCDVINLEWSFQSLASCALYFLSPVLDIYAHITVLFISLVAACVTFTIVTIRANQKERRISSMQAVLNARHYSFSVEWARRSSLDLFEYALRSSLIPSYKVAKNRKFICWESRITSNEPSNHKTSGISMRDWRRAGGHYLQNFSWTQQKYVAFETYSTRYFSRRLKVWIICWIIDLSNPSR